MLATLYRRKGFVEKLNMNAQDIDNKEFIYTNELCMWYALRNLAGLCTSWTRRPPVTASPASEFMR